MLCRIYGYGCSLSGRTGSPLWKDVDEVRKNWAIDQTFYPQMSMEDRKKKLSGWKKAVKYACGWAKEE